MTKRVLIIGAYGNFGSHITTQLSRDNYIQVIIAGRSTEKCKAFAEKLISSPNPPIWFALDIHDKFSDALQTIAPDIVIHTSGPFQGQGYNVAKACIDYGCHYIDLADGRAFVSGIGQLDEHAKAKKLCIISGASSVPCLTSAIIMHYQSQFKKITTVDYGISTAQRTNTGLATTAAVLGYAGKPFATLINGKPQTIYGWQDLHCHNYPELGWRLLGNCDVPDLELFPEYFKDIQTIRFYAGLEIPFIHLGLWALSWLVRANIINNLGKYAEQLLKMSRWFDWLGSDRSAFHMKLSGTALDGTSKEAGFSLIAKSGHGPYIPSTPAIILARLLASGELSRYGAMPCIGLLSLEQYLEGLKELDIKSLKR